MTYRQLLQGMEYTGTPPGGEATGVAQDSRRLEAGGVFVCVQGRSFDGHRFAAQALQEGAGMVVTQRPLGLAREVTVPDTRVAYAGLCSAFFGNPAQQLKLVGVTGTNGKTTVSFLLKEVLQRQGIRCGLIGTVRSEIGALEIPAKFTTPDAWDLNVLFSRMVAADCTHCVMETSSQALDQGRLLGLRFDLGIFTNLSQDHLDWHDDMQSYFAAKAQLFAQSKRVLANIDDAWGRRLLGEWQGGEEAFGFSTENDNADFVARSIQLRAGGVRFALLHGSSLLPVRFAMPGAFSVSNALAAGAAAILLGCPGEQVADALAEVQGVPGRCEVLYSGIFTVIRDFAHTGDAMHQLLAALRPQAENRLLVLFGCAGNRDAAKRPAMGQAAADYGDVIYLTADNPRTEPIEKTINDALGPIAESGKPHFLFNDREQAIRAALADAQPGDMLVLCSKGHEDYQVLNGVTIFFDEKQIVQLVVG